MYRVLAFTALCFACTRPQKPNTAATRGHIATPATRTVVTAPLEFTSLAAARTRNPYDTLVDIGNVRLHIRCAGTGKPTVVFDAGLGLDASSWQHVQSDIAALTRSCAYDRAGRGLSGPARYPRGQRQMADELYSLLQKSGQEGPYVLVGHSMAGANVRWFLHAHPEEVVGMVLLEPATEDWPKQVLPRVPVNAVPDFWRNLRAWEGIDAELFITGYEELRNSESLGERPLLILTAGKPENDLASRREMHGKLKRLSTNSAHIVVERSVHNIQLDAPGAVIPCVRAVVHAARTGSRLSEASLQKGH